MALCRPASVSVLLVASGLSSVSASDPVVINEVLADPPGNDHHEEFVELFNAGADPVELEGWRIGDAEEEDAIIDAGDGTTLPPGGFAIVVDASYFGASAVYDSMRGWARIVTIEDRSFGRAGWSNSSPESVLLRDQRGATVDSVAYDPSDGVSGHSWERRSGLPILQPSHLAGGTPGRANSVDQQPAPPGGVEIEARPDPFRHDLELLCRLPAAPALLSVTVFDAEGLRIARLADWVAAALETKLVWDGRDMRGEQAPAGAYVILVQSSAAGRVVSGKKVVIRR